MKTGLLFLLAATPALAQDPVAADPAHNTLLLDNDRVRVFETRLAPGETSAMHSHPAFVAYSLTDAQAKFTFENGTSREVTLKQGLTAWNPPLTHSVLNTGTTGFRVLHVELKEAPQPPEVPRPVATESHYFNEADLKWVDAPPDSLPKGCRIAILEGDPSRPGPFTMRVKFPAGSRMQPHWHPADEHATVLSGVLKVGKGDAFDENKTAAITRSGFMLMPAGMHHFALFPEETVLQLHGMGPWKVIYLEEAKAVTK